MQLPTRFPRSRNVGCILVFVAGMVAASPLKFIWLLLLILFRVRQATLPGDLQWLGYGVFIGLPFLAVSVVLTWVGYLLIARDAQPPPSSPLPVNGKPLEYDY